MSDRKMTFRSAVVAGQRKRGKHVDQTRRVDDRGREVRER